MIARLRVQPALRVGGALLTGTAALGRLADRLGAPNPVARAADSAGSHTTPMLATLALAAAAAAGWTLATRRRALPKPGEPGPAPSPGGPAPSPGPDERAGRVLDDSRSGGGQPLH